MEHFKMSRSIQHDPEPTIIDAWNVLMRTCCKCKCCNFKKKDASFREMKEEEDWEDEVEKAMKHKSNKNNIANDSIGHDLRRALMEHDDNDNNDNNINNKSKIGSARMRCYCIPCLKYKPLIWQLISISVIIELLIISIMGIIDLIQNENIHRHFKIFSQILIGIMWFIQLIVLIQLILISIKKLWNLTLKEIIQLYLTSILLFTAIYATAHFSDSDHDKNELKSFQAFNLSDTQFKDNNYIERIIAFFYLSCSQQTLCGVSEIIPKSPITMILAGIQMLFGIFFSIIIISIGISRLGEDIEKRQEIQDMELLNNNNNNNNNNCWYIFTHNEKVIKIRRRMRRFLLLIVIIIQATENILEWKTSNTKFANKHKIVHSLLFDIFDVINVSFVLITSLKFIHIGHMTELKLSFLCQTYLSIMIIFAGFYVDLQESSSSDDNYSSGAFVLGDTTYIGLWCKLLYYSFALMTLCGSGLHIKPKTWYATLAVCNQMLLGVFFHAYIFGVGLLILANSKYTSNKKQIKSRDEKENKTVTSHIAGSQLIMSTLLQN